MEHKHGVFDSDTRFSINPITRQIKNDSNRKIVLIQNDHKSEVFTFECPRTVEGHDMSLCNEVEVHFLNISSDKKKEKSGFVTLKDFRLEDDKVVCSWEIDINSTRLAGSLNFLLFFKCKENDVITYGWHTAIYEGIFIAKGINADESFESDYVDVIERWKAKVMAHFTAELAAWKETTAAEVREEAFKDIATERKRIDMLSNYVTPEMFGAVGDGVTDDTEAIQNCFNFAHTNNLCVEFFKKTYVAYGLTLGAGVFVNGNGATLKKPDLSADPYDMTVEQMKWIRMLQVFHSGDSDSKTTYIRDMEFDGNCWTMWEVTDGYAQEQASLLFLTADNAKSGRLNVVVENCYFHDSPSDGVHVVTNVNATIKNCRSLDCFRGGLTVTGGYTIVNVDGFEFNSNQTNDGIDIEVDSLGYGDTREIIVNLSNILIDRDLDINASANSRVNVNNLVMRKGGYVLLTGGELTVKNSYLLTDDVNYTMNMANMVYILKNAHMVFENVVFDGQGTENAACQTIYYEPEKTKVDFNGCRFVNAAWGISGSSTKTDATITVVDCVFETTNGFGGDCGSVPMVVPVVKLLNNIFNVEGVAIKCHATSVTPSTLEVSGNTMKKCAKGMWLHAPTLIMHDEVWDNGLAIQYSNGHSTAKYFGKRMNIVESDPNGITGIGGMHFEDRATDGTSLWEYTSGTKWTLVE